MREVPALTRNREMKDIAVDSETRVITVLLVEINKLYYNFINFI